MLDEPSPIVAGKQVTAYAAAADLTWMTWDTTIHFDVEIECIWQRPASWAKWAYIFIRYIPVLHGGAILTLSGELVFPASGCKGWIIEQLVAIETLTLTVEAVLVMRLYVLYNHNRLVLLGILTAFFAEVVCMVTTLGLVIPKQTFTPDCLVASSPRIYMMYWLSSLVFETFLFALTLVKFFQSAMAMYRRESLLYIFVRDGTWAFAVIFVALLLNTLTYQLFHTSIAGMGYFWALSVMSFAGSHVLLNLRRLSLPPPKESLPTIQFGAAAPDNTTRSSDVILNELSEITFRNGPGSADNLAWGKSASNHDAECTTESRTKSSHFIEELCQYVCIRKRS